jgi:2-iminoacetate synthase ThiH
MVSILGGKMRTKPLLFPKSILIETCNLCQGSCLFCPYSKIRKGQKKELLEYKIIKKLINEMTDYYVERQLYLIIMNLC